MLCRIYGSDVELCNDLMTNITVYIYILIIIILAVTKIYFNK